MHENKAGDVKMPTKPIKFLVACAGGFGREVYHWLCTYAMQKYGTRGTDWEVIGFLDDNQDADLSEFGNLPAVVGPINGYQAKPDERVVVAAGRPAVRRKVVAALQAGGAMFESMIHPTVIIEPNTTIGQGAIVGPFSYISCDTKIGEFALVNNHVSIGHDVVIGDFCDICPHVALAGIVTLGDDVFLGSNVTIIPGKRVGSGSQISAGATIFRNLRSNCLVQPAPNKIYKDFFKK